MIFHKFFNNILFFKPTIRQINFTNIFNNKFILFYSIFTNGKELNKKLFIINFNFMHINPFPLGKTLNASGSTFISII